MYQCMYKLMPSDEEEEIEEDEEDDDENKIAVIEKTAKDGTRLSLRRTAEAETPNSKRVS